MEDIAISDWPGQALDISGSNPWLPAYGFQSPSALLEREDFIGNPDAEYFLHGEPPQYVYLETIQEETSDDLRSESDISETRTSPVGWLATDSEAGSVIRIDIDDVDCESDREAACPAKRRKQEHLLTIVIDDDFQSLSRSSSLLQFETLEKQCQETCSSSPSIYSQFSFDSLDNQRKNNVSPDSLDRVQSDCQHDLDNFKRLELEDCGKKQNSNDSLLYNATRYSGSDSSDTGNSDETLEASRSFDNLRTWRSFDSLPITNPTNTGKLKDKISAENLSEDSGYSDHLYGTSSYSKIKNGGTSLLNSVNNRISAKCATSMMKSRIEADYFGLNKLDIRNTPGDFPAYDGEGFQYFSGNFGASYQDLSVFDKYEVSDNHRSPLIDRFMRNRRQGNLVTKIVNIEKSSECERPSKYNCTSASEPNLQQIDSTSPSYSADSKPSNVSSNSFNKSSVCVCSVPKNLNLLSDSKCLNDVRTFEINSPSIATKNYDLGDLTRNSFKPHSYSATELEKSNCDSFHSSKSSEFVTINSDRVDLNDMSSFKREGSYAEAMSNRVDLSDDENSLTFQTKPQTLKPRNTLEDFDRKVLKAISETSIQSMASSKIDLDESVFTSTPMAVQRRNVASTPNLSLINKQELNNFLQEERRRSTHDIRRKEASYVNRSTSTSGMSDLEDKPVPSVKSLSESISSKGVHFSPVVSEVNWQDDTESTVTLERESSYSLQSSPERELTPPNAPIIIKPQARLPPPVQSQMSYSQPDLNPNPKEDFLRSLKSFREDFAKSQPNLSRFRRRGSQLIKKDKDGCVIKAYIDGDGFQYHHTHLDLDNIYTSKTPTTSTESHVGASNNTQSIHTKSVAGMDVRVQDAPRKDKGKFGGFFSRLASFRFSGRKDEKARKKKSVEPKGQLMTGGVRTASPHQRIATKDDYIYIPLKGPPLTENNNLQKMHEGGSLLVSGKPPVPRAPPRVVGACVKKDGSAQGVGEQQERRRRRTIDSGSRPRPMEPMGLIETDLDTEVTVITDGANVKTRSLLNLGARPAQQQLSVAPRETHRPHKSMEFLLDKQNLKVVEPPENELQKGERVMSEHQLRVQRSLQKLTIPDWYKQSQIPQEGFLLKKNATRESRWTGTGNKTTSLSSLGPVNQSHVILSPTPQSQPFVRWSTSKLNSTASSPCASTRSSFNARQPNGSISPLSVRSSFSYRQPYMGWRSQERLTRPRTPAERLANTLLSHANQTHQPQESPEIQTSIKEVTSAIVHYVSGLRPEDTRGSYDSQDTTSQRSSSVSPRGSQKLYWLESSFVGTKPLDSPQTPVTLSESSNPGPPSSLRLELQNHNDVTLMKSGILDVKPSPGSTTLEDVLDSLLGLPSSARAPSPSLQETASANTSPNHKRDQIEPFRRRSEGSEPSTFQPSRRVSFNSSPVLRCRYSRCGRIAMASTTEGSAYKNCHNCSYTYCSRACRRAHWEKHRKTCLFSRIGTLCRQVIASTKEQKNTLLHLSSIARRGYMSHGPGAVKCFFPCPETAENFLINGLQSLGELTYIRWQNLLPNEMGPNMYAELVKMCKNYNPDSKLVLYISVCVISETPTTGSVKWERQLVSRCAKMRLSKCIPIPEREYDNPETLILTCFPIKGNDMKVKELKENCINNVQKQLRQRGVSLRRHHPDIYRQLSAYAEGHCIRFTPVTVYPKDVATGKSFMCIIMLEAESESVKQVEMAGVRVKTVDVLCDYE